LVSPRSSACNPPIIKNFIRARTQNCPASDFSLHD
jgi:hypothetical protein